MLARHYRKSKIKKTNQRPIVQQNNINWDTNQKILKKKKIRDYKRQWAKKEKVDSRVLDEWQCKILETVHARIDKLKTKKNKNPRKKHDETCKNYLQDFQKQFVLVPADKANNDILIVCNKKYYLDVELDTCNGTSPQTYTPCGTHVENLITEHQQYMHNQNKNSHRYETTTNILLAP